MRKLASVQKVKAVTPIENADRIELVHVLGWQCVAKKGEFKPGDYCVYFEIDSFLPIRPEFEFLRSSSYMDSPILGEGFRLKTQKFRGEISQGLCLPCSLFPELWVDDIEGMPCVVLSEGQDVTEKLGVKKFEMPEMATTGGTTIGRLPSTIPHTDETRVQASPELIQEFAGLKYYISTKMDGSSHSIGIDANGFHVTGHNYEYKDDGKSDFYEFVKQRGFEPRLRNYMYEHELSSITVQGELCAPGIQKNRLKLKAPEWYVFTVIEDGKRVPLAEMLRVAEFIKAEHVPIEEIDDNLPGKYPDVDALLARADGNYPNGGKKEGVVIRPCEPVYSKTIGAELSMKVVNNKYLLKNE